MGYSQLKREIEGIAAVGDAVRVIEKISAVNINRFRRLSEHLNEYISVIELTLRELSSEHRLVHELFTEKPSPGPTAIVVVSSDRGLVGNYNRSISELALSLPIEDKRYIVIGNQGQKLLEHAGAEIVRSFPAFSDAPTEEETGAIRELLLSSFRENRFGAVVVVYSHFHSFASSDPTVEAYLPFSARPIMRKPIGQKVLSIHEPGAASIAEALLEEYIGLAIYRIALDAKLSEVAARTLTAGSAADRADDLEEKKRLDFFKGRRAEITSAIMELFSSRHAARGRSE